MRTTACPLVDAFQARNRKDNAAACLAVIRRLAVNIARSHPDKLPVRRKFLVASWKPEYLLDLRRNTASSRLPKCDSPDTTRRGKSGRAHRVE